MLTTGFLDIHETSLISVTHLFFLWYTGTHHHLNAFVAPFIVFQFSELSLSTHTPGPHYVAIGRLSFPVLLAQYTPRRSLSDHGSFL